MTMGMMRPYKATELIGDRQSANEDDEDGNQAPVPNEFLCVPVQHVLYTQDSIKARFQNAPEDCQWLEDLIDKLGNKDLTTSCSHSLPTARLCFDDYTSEQRIERLLSCRTASTQEPIFSTIGLSLIHI